MDLMFVVLLSTAVPMYDSDHFMTPPHFPPQLPSKHQTWIIKIYNIRGSKYGQYKHSQQVNNNTTAWKLKVSRNLAALRQLTPLLLTCARPPRPLRRRRPSSSWRRPPRTCSPCPRPPRPRPPRPSRPRSRSASGHWSLSALPYQYYMGAENIFVDIFKF